MLIMPIIKIVNLSGVCFGVYSNFEEAKKEYIKLDTQGIKGLELKVL